MAHRILLASANGNSLMDTGAATSSSGMSWCNWQPPKLCKADAEWYESNRNHLPRNAAVLAEIIETSVDAVADETSRHVPVGKIPIHTPMKGRRTDWFLDSTSLFHSGFYFGSWFGWYIRISFVAVKTPNLQRAGKNKKSSYWRHASVQRMRINNNLANK